MPKGSVIKTDRFGKIPRRKVVKANAPTETLGALGKMVRGKQRLVYRPKDPHQNGAERRRVDADICISKEAQAADVFIGQSIANEFFGSHLLLSPNLKAIHQSAVGNRRTANSI